MLAIARRIQKKVQRTKIIDPRYGGELDPAQNGLFQGLGERIIDLSRLLHLDSSLARHFSRKSHQHILRF